MLVGIAECCRITFQTIEVLGVPANFVYHCSCFVYNLLFGKMEGSALVCCQS